VKLPSSATAVSTLADGPVTRSPIPLGRMAPALPRSVTCPACGAVSSIFSAFAEGGVGKGVATQPDDARRRAAVTDGRLVRSHIHFSSRRMMVSCT
jgi:hypothetical protein